MNPIIWFGNEVTINPILISIGGFDVYWYGAIIALAFIASLIFVLRRVKNNKNSYGIKEDNIYDFALGVLLVGILSARAYYVLFNLKEYLANPLDIFKIWNGGLAIYGGIIGVTIFAFFFCKKNNVKFFNLADLAIPYLALCQSLGRWGNFINQEAFGYETTMPWKMGIFDKTLGEYVFVHPTFIYESICTFILFWLLLYFSSEKRRKFSGQVFFTYLMVYGFIRFFIEGLRADSLMLGNFRVSQLLSFILFVIACGTLFVKTKHAQKNKI